MLAHSDDAALKVGVEFVFDESRQHSAGLFYLCDKGLVVLAHQPVERRLLGAAALVTRRACGGGTLGRFAHRCLGHVTSNL